MKVNLIVAFDSNFLIGDSKTFNLPWNIKEDMDFFKNLTSTVQDNKFNYLICGYNTWFHCLKDRKLKNRKLIVINRDINDFTIYDNSTFFINNINLLCNSLNKFNDINKIFCIGGSKLYKYFLKFYNLLDFIYITQIKKKFKGDIFFPYKMIQNFKLISCNRVITKNNIKLDFCKYIISTDNQEIQYIKLVQKILNSGIKCNDRTNTGIISYFGSQCEYDLTNNIIPILTTKKVFLKAIIHELLWFLRGNTNNKDLKDKGVRIWNDNSTRSFLDSRGLQRLEDDDCGAIYGFQMRHFGAQYIDCNSDYSNKGFDQIQYVIDEIKNNPDSRRILFSMWNPPMFKDMCLLPCHIMYQFRVYGDKLCLSMYQRSGDIMLGVPFNITSSCILLYIIAKLTNKIPWKFIHSIGDNHIYSNHIDGANEQITRNILGFPMIKINDNKTFNTVEDFEYTDFNILGYMSHKPIKLKMAI